MSIGIWQLLLIVIVVILLFGTKRVPTMMEDLAKGLNAFKKGLKEEDVKSIQSNKSKEDDSKE
jgi:sec-independent protein translocase protein TatA